MKKGQLLTQRPPSFFQEEMDWRGIKTRVAGNIAFCGSFQSWLQNEYRYSNRAPPQRWMDRSCKGENCSTCANCVRCRLVLCLGGRWEKDFEGCSKCTHCNKCVASGNDEDWEIFHTQAQKLKISYVHLKLKASRNCRRQSWLKAAHFRRQYPVVSQS